LTEFLDEQAARIHKKLNLNKMEQTQQAMLKEANLDCLQKSGIVQAVISKRQRRKEIDRNNRLVVSALKEAKTINKH